MRSTPWRTRLSVVSPRCGRRIGCSAAAAAEAVTRTISAARSERRKVRRKGRSVPDISEDLDSRAMERFAGKRGLVFGVANRRSIAWAIAKQLADGGASLAFTFQGERIEKGVRELAETVSCPLVTELDVRDDDAIARVFDEVGEAFGGKLDILVHSVAFAAADDASVRYLAWDLGQKNIRINAVSAGPVRTLAARSIAGFSTMESIIEERSPLHRPID